MGPKFAVGQIVIITKCIYFHLDDLIIRACELGRVAEIDEIASTSANSIFYDYIVVVRDKPLFFYENELQAYPEKEEK